MFSLHTYFVRVERWILLGSILMSVSPCFAQENIRFERISVNEGLSQSDIRSMVQDKFGFLWIGTRDGLNRYDGFEFRRYGREENNSNSLQFNQILDLKVDSLGDIWIGSTGGISIYDYRKDNFQNFFPADNELQNADINHILLTGEQRALLSTSKGLVTFDLRQQRFFIENDMKSFRGVRVLNSQQTQAHGLWIATEKGVFVKTSAQPDWTRVLEDTSVQHIHFDPNGRVYLSAAAGLFSYDLKTKETKRIALPPGITAVTEVMRTKNGELWIACNKVVVLGENDSVKHVLEHDKFDNQSLSEDRARILFQTHDDVIWVGTFGYGLNKFNPDVAKFSYLSDRTAIPLSGNYVSTIFTADDTILFVGTSRGLDVVNLQTKSANHISSKKDLFQILKIVVDRYHNIWVATSNGFMLYSGNRMIPKNTSLRSVYSFAEWNDTTLILASRLDGIFLFDRKTDSTLPFISANDLPEEVSCLLVEDSHLWVGCKDGLKLYNRKGELKEHFKANNQEPGSLHSSFIKSVYRDTKENLWVGTWGGGLSKLNPGDSTFTTYTVSDGLPNNVIYGMLEDSSGKLWLSTNLGLSAFNFTDYVFRNFDFFDGLQSNEFNTGAYFQSARGKLYFGGVNGLTFFNSDDILQYSSVPPILTTSITVNNKPAVFQNSDSIANVALVENIQSRWSENDIGVAFTAVDFKQADKYIFQYTIKDSTWHDIGNRRSLELIDLQSGRHQLKLRTGTANGNWSAPVTLLNIDIVPPVWQMVWFRIIAVLAFLVVVFMLYRYRVARLRRTNAILNKLVSERTLEIEAKNEEIAAQNDQLHELNEELEAFSYSVSHDLRAPLRSVIGYSKILEEDFYEKLDNEGKRVLSVIQNNAVKMNYLIDDFLEFSKLSKKELQKSETDTKSLVISILDEINATTPHRAEIRVSTLPSVYADDKLLSQVWINLISNAIKYSSKKAAPVVEIGSYYEGNEIIFFVKDNGAGFDMKYLDKLFGVFQRLHRADEFEGTGVGLALVERIVSKHGGRVWAEGKLNAGATFYFSMSK